MCSNGANDGASSLPSTRRHPVPVLPRAVCAGAAEFSIPTCPRRAVGQMYVELVESASRSAWRPPRRQLAPPPASGTTQRPPPRRARPWGRNRAAGPAGFRPAAWPQSPIFTRTPRRPYSRARSPQAGNTRPGTSWCDPARRSCHCTPFIPAAAPSQTCDHTERSE